MLETLESRTLFAATVADPTSTALNFTKQGDIYSLNFTKIKYDTKVAAQDFHFTSKVSQQDFHFVMTHNATSPT
jgi:hypothetical protein